MKKIWNKLVVVLAALLLFIIPLGMNIQNTTTSAEAVTRTLHQVTRIYRKAIQINNRKQNKRNANEVPRFFYFVATSREGYSTY